MPMTRKRKDAVIKDASARAEEASVIVLTGFSGIDVATDTEFRRTIRNTGGHYQVIKNTLAKRVLAGDEYADLHGHMKGETAYVFGGEDPVATLKALTDFVGDHKDHLSVKGGYFEGQVLDPAQIKELADIPPREVLLTRLATALQTPIQRLANVLQAPITKLAGTLQALAEKREKE